MTGSLDAQTKLISVILLHIEVANNMPVEPLFAPSEIRAFGQALFLSPSDLPTETQHWIAVTVGASQNRLQISETNMMDHFAKRNISAVGFVWCDPDAWAFASLQYYDWFGKGEPQMWLADLCRMGIRPTDRSPVGELLKLFTDCLLAHGVHELWLMVDCDENADTLCRVYESYGFQQVRRSTKLNCIFMKRVLLV